MVSKRRNIAEWARNRIQHGGNGHEIALVGNKEEIAAFLMDKQAFWIVDKRQTVACIQQSVSPPGGGRRLLR